MNWNQRVADSNIRSDANLISENESSSNAMNLRQNEQEVLNVANLSLRQNPTSNSKFIHGTKYDIDKYFPSSTYKNLKLGLIRMKDRKYFVQECVVCLEPVENISICRMLSCFHIFHKDCIDSWLVSQASCPLCNKRLKKREDIKINYEQQQLHSISVDNDAFYSDHIVIRKP